MRRSWMSSLSQEFYTWLTNYTMKTEQLCEIAFQIWKKIWDRTIRLDAEIADNFVMDITAETMLMFYERVHEECNADMYSNISFYDALSNEMQWSSLLILWKRFVEEYKFENFTQSIEDMLTHNPRYESFTELQILIKKNYWLVLDKSWLDNTEGDHEWIIAINSSWWFIDIFYTKGKTWIYVTNISISKD